MVDHVGRAQWRRDTAANWTSANTVLAVAELGYETDTNTYKIGDGVTAWNSLAYQAAQGPAGNDGTDGADGNDGNDGAAGQGVPTGGAINQILSKTSGTDFDTQWVNPSAGGGGDAWGDAVDANIIPDANDTRNIGSDGSRFAQAHLQTLNLDGEPVVILAKPAVDSFGFFDRSKGTLGEMEWLTSHPFLIVDTTLTLNPASLVDSLIIEASDETTDLTTGTKVTFRMPYAFTLTDIRASLTTAPTGATMIVDVNDGGTSIMTTDKLLFDIGATTTVGASTEPTLTDTALADNAAITIDVDQIGSTVAGAGLKIYLIGYKT